MTVRFGPFEVDIDSAELRKNGVRLQLQEQPFRVLTALLERPGEVVSREELSRRLWSDGTHVDFERGLNAAVTRLRQTLTDSAERPRYVETVARRGYRFIALLEAAGEQDLAPVARQTEEPPNQPSRRLVRVIAGALLIGAVALLWVMKPREAVAPVLQPAPLTSYQGVETQPSFSPDGTQVAFSWNGEAQDNFDIYVQAVGSGAPLRLTTGAAADRSPAWSPDGRFIAFQREGQGIFLVPPTGGAERLAVASTGARGQIAWSADSRILAYAALATDSHAGGIFAVAAQGGSSRRLITPELTTHVRDPAISPDGRWLAFVSCSGGDKCDLLVVEVDAQLEPSGAAQRVTSMASSVYSPAWTSGSDAILFSENTGRGHPGQRLWMVARRPRAAPQIVGFGAAHSAFPAVSRAGSRMAYSSDIGEVDIWRIESGAFSRAAMSSTQTDTSPEFSPDGKRVVFASTRSGNSEVWVSDSDGNNSVQLTSSKRSGSPRWSPDGNLIVYDTQAPDGNWDIHAISAAGGQSRPIVQHPSSDVAPSFSRDGKWIYFCSNRRGREMELYRVAVSGGDPERLIEGAGGAALESVDGKFVYYLNPAVGCHPLFEFPLSGGEPRKVADAVCNRAFAVTHRGVYYVSGRLEVMSGVLGTIWGPVTVQILEPESGNVRGLATTQDKFHLAQGLTVSPDGRVILLAGSDRADADLYMVENFR